MLREPQISCLLFLFRLVSDLDSAMNHKQSIIEHNLQFHTSSHQNQDTTSKTTFNTRTFLGKSKKSPPPVLAKVTQNSRNFQATARSPSYSHDSLVSNLALTSKPSLVLRSGTKMSKTVFLLWRSDFWQGGGDAFMWRQR